MTGIDFDVEAFVNHRPWCEVWPVVPLRVRLDLHAHGGPHFAERRLPAEQIAHICRGSGREHYFANVLHANSWIHRWCDSHGAAGLVVLFAAKHAAGGADFALWGRLMSGCNNVFGWLETDRVIEQCRRWDCERLRLGLLSATEAA